MSDSEGLLVARRSRQPRICSKCGKSFATSFDLKKHIAIHTRLETYTCTVCGQEFYQLINLKVHEETHGLTKTNHCPKCGKGFNTVFNLTRHVNFHHEFHYTCSVCNKKFNSFPKLRDHKKTNCAASNLSAPNPVIQNKNFVCMACGEKFHDLFLLKQHITTHEAKKSFSCMNDGKDSLELSSPVASEVNHTATKKEPLICTVSGQNYFELEEKIIHKIQNHLTCTDCGIRFCTAVELKEHLKRLMTSCRMKWRSCICTCGKKFNCLSKLKRHLGGNYHKACFCGLHFKTASKLEENNDKHKTKNPLITDTCATDLQNYSDIESAQKSAEKLEVEDNILKENQESQTTIFSVVSVSTQTPNWSKS